MKYLYYIYQLFVAFPIVIVATIITGIVTGIGCSIGNGHFWGYFPGHCWGWVITRAFLLPVKVEGRENLEKGHSYVFVANHQGAFDIFLIYGFLCRNFKWMMKYQLKKIPFVGYACRKIKKTYDDARKTLSSGISVVVFPEGARSFTGHMGQFRKGAFMLADELQLPVVPITLNGPFDVMPRTRDWHFAKWHPLSLTIHQPIYPVDKGQRNIQATMHQAYDSVMSSLEEKYQGYVENPDQ